MALAKDTNSYVTRAEANTYFTDRLDAAAWNAATDPDKDQALITATALLEQQSYTGYMVEDTQALAFPRVGEYFDPRVGSVVIFESDVVPTRMITANYEMALHLLNNSGLLDDTGRVKSLKVDKIELISIRNPSRIPTFVDQYIRPLLSKSGQSSNWYRAN
jgi:hypothetical protein